ncbi:MAG TPA: hypothetical protein VFR65_06615 [Nitrososphaeraceae archaeon]|jgi:hypothetical protein|nr:hypothetical protein [Nitrososphaeraceae archaeon]
MSAINYKRKFGLGNDSSRKLSSFAEFWKGLGIIVGIWAVIYFIIMVATGNIM